MFDIVKTYNELIGIRALIKAITSEILLWDKDNKLSFFKLENSEF